MQLDTVKYFDWRDLMADLSDDSADMILTDMPYGTTACSWDTVIDLDAWWAEAHRVAKPRAAIVCTGSQPFTSRLVMSNVKRFRYEWVWEKPIATQFLDAKRRPLKAHENIMIFSTKSHRYYPQMAAGAAYSTNTKAPQTSIYGSHYRVPTSNNGGRYPRTVIEFDNDRGLHPTQKPIALFEYLIRTYTQPGDLVVDPFVGSGTTALAARNTGRRFVCGDFTQKYVEIARARLAEPYTPDMFDTLLPDDDPKPIQQPLELG